MFARIALAASLFASSLSPLAASADALKPCELLNGSVADVRAHRTEEHVGKVTVQRLDGASLFVPAKPGLTAEWLQRSLAAHVGAMHGKSMSDCPLEASHVRIQVRSGGSGYWVDVIAKDHQQAEFVLQRAEGLLHHAG